MLLNYFMVENSGIEPLTSCVQSRRSPSWAKAPQDLSRLNKTNVHSLSLERRWSSRTFRYGYLVTTSPQLSSLPSAAPSHTAKHNYCYSLYHIRILTHKPGGLFPRILIPALCLPVWVRSLTSGIDDSHGVTGGVYKTRERIHRSMLTCDY